MLTPLPFRFGPLVWIVDQKPARAQIGHTAGRDLLRLVQRIASQASFQETRTQDLGPTASYEWCSIPGPTGDGCRRLLPVVSVLAPEKDIMNVISGRTKISFVLYIPCS